MLWLRTYLTGRGDRIIFSVIITGILLHTAALAGGADVERGKYLTHAAGCIACHTTEDGAPFAGGLAMESPFGTFYTPNITPDKETGIGGWSDADFLTALHSGVSPDKDNYYPAFPYTSYTGMSDKDALAIKAYLDSQPAVVQTNKDHELVWYASMRWTLSFWKWLYLDEARFTPVTEQSEQWNRGAYLVRHLGHCGECHTPRTVLGGLRKNSELAGAPGFGDAKKAPNLTPHEDGLKNWSRSDWELLLEIGMLPNGDFAGGEMGLVVDENTSLLSPDDRQAIISYLRSLPPLPDQY